MYSGIVCRRFLGSTIHFLPYLTKAFCLFNNNKKKIHILNLWEKIFVLIRKLLINLTLCKHRI